MRVLLKLIRGLFWESFGKMALNLSRTLIWCHPLEDKDVSQGKEHNNNNDNIT